MINNFDKILLYHPQYKMKYIRKLTMSYGYYTVLAIVNKNNRVTHIGIDNTFQIIPYKELTEEDKNILGNNKCNNLKPNDLLNIYQINKAIPVPHYNLHKQCTNMRYTTPEETYALKKLLIENKDKVITVKNNREYKDNYKDQAILNLNNITLNIRENLQEIRLDHYNNIKAKGQTRLI